MILQSREDLRLALRQSAKDEGLSLNELADKIYCLDNRELGPSRRTSIKHGPFDTYGRHRVSWDKLMRWINLAGYEIHFELRKKGTTHNEQARNNPTRQDADSSLRDAGWS